VPLTNTVAGDIVAENQLPLRPDRADRLLPQRGGVRRPGHPRHAASASVPQSRIGLIAHPDKSGEEHEWMTRSAELVLETLGLPYRRVLLSSGDTGFPSARTHDLEVWLPGQQMFRKSSSCSNCKDFQARRMNARFRAADGKTIAYVHTLNGSGVAMGRALIAVMEELSASRGSIECRRSLAPLHGWAGYYQPP